MPGRAKDPPRQRDGIDVLWHGCKRTVERQCGIPEHDKLVNVHMRPPAGEVSVASVIQRISILLEASGPTCERLVKAHRTPAHKRLHNPSRHLCIPVATLVRVQVDVANTQEQVVPKVKIGLICFDACT